MAARNTEAHSLAVEVPRTALVSSPAHPALHHRHLVHLRRCQRRVQALLSWDGAKPRGTTWSRSTRPEGELHSYSYSASHFCCWAVFHTSVL